MRSLPPLLLAALLGGAPASAGSAAAQEASGTAAPATSAASVASAEDRAAYLFALAKLLAAEGSFQEALSSYEEAARLVPGDPYIHLEHAQLLARVADISRAPRSRAEHLAAAAMAAGKARELAPRDVDVLRGAGEIYLRLAEQDPAATATAREVLEDLREVDPTDVQAMLTLGRIYMDDGEPAKAAGVFRQLAGTAPQRKVVYSLLVEALLRAGRKEEAEQVLLERLGFDEGSLDARLILAELQSGRGDHRAALETLLAAPEELRTDPQLRRQLASALYLTGDLDAALKTADELLAAQPDNHYLALLKGLILTAEGRNHEALELLAKLREAEPRNLVLAATLSRVLRREGRHAEAAALFAGLVAELDKEAGKDAARARDAQDARLELAQIHLETKDWAKVSQVLAPLLSSKVPAVRTEALLLQTDALVAMADYGRALELLGPEADGEKMPLLAAKRAEVTFRAGKERQAVRQLEKLARSEDPQAVLAAVQAFHRLQRYEESIPMLQRVLASRPNMPAAGFLLGSAYERTGRRAEAVAAFRQVLQTDPDFHAALNYLGYMLAEVGEDLDEALKLVKRAVALDPDNGAYVDSLGWTHFRLGQYDRARDYLERATRLVPEDPTVAEHLGDVYVALGERDKARRMYQRALDLGIENADQLRRKLDGLRLDDSPRR